MGYRSEVVMCFNAPDRERMDAFEAKVRLEHDEEFFKHIDGIRRVDTVWVWEWESVKWYPSYEDVQAWEGVMISLEDDEESEISCEFMRVGEEEGDVEHRAYGDVTEYRVSTHTTITVDI